MTEWSFKLVARGQLPVKDRYLLMSAGMHFLFIPSPPMGERVRVRGK
jgi:hypothetical protein